jgi:predicted nucleic acid-binding protein
MSVLIDTNVLLRRTQPDHSHHAAAVESVTSLLATGEPVCFTPQNAAKL